LGYDVARQQADEIKPVVSFSNETWGKRGLGGSLKFTDATFYNPVQYGVSLSIIYWSFLCTFKTSGVMSQERHLNVITLVKPNIAYLKPFRDDHGAVDVYPSPRSVFGCSQLVGGGRRRDAI